MNEKKGQWEVSKIGNNYDQYSIYSEDNKTIASYVEGEANAKLIAQCPNMIELIQKAYNQGWLNHVPTWKKAAREIIEATE